MSDLTDLIGGLGGVAGFVAAVIGASVNKKAKDAETEAKNARTAADNARTAADNATTAANEARNKALEAMAKAEEAQSKAQSGLLELQLRAHLSSRRDKIHEVTRETETIRDGRPAEAMQPTEIERLKDVHKRFLSAHEDFLGALEQGCRHYRDGKLDKNSFRLMYESEVRDVCDSPAESVFYSFMHPADPSRFQAIWAVYREWFRSKV